MAAVTDRISLRGMRFEGRHGVSDEERAARQPIDVDIDVRLDLSLPGRTDELADTVNYSELFDLARRIVEDRSFKLLEALATTIAEAVLAAHPVEEVEVRVRKPKAPLSGAFEAVEVRIRRRAAS